MVPLFLVMDSLAPPIGLTSVTARTNNTQMIVEGKYQVGQARPILVWPKNTEPWLNPCRMATDLCCLREVNAKYRNDALSAVQGPSCLQSLSGDFVGGSRPNVFASTDSFQAVVPVGTQFVAVLFVHYNPFFILDGYQAFRPEAASTVESTLIMAHNPCYSVVVPGTLVSVCMQCNNPLPPNARYVWTQSWYNDYYCEWQCNPDFVKSGAGCDIALTKIPWMEIGVAGGACVVVVIIILSIYCTLRRNAAVVLPEPAAPVISKSDMIQFKDEVKELELRIKRH